MWQVSFVDLAGSERLKDSQSQGGMVKETSNINRSLFTLGKVRTCVRVHVCMCGWPVVISVWGI